MKQLLWTIFTILLTSAAWMAAYLKEYLDKHDGLLVPLVFFLIFGGAFWLFFAGDFIAKHWDE